MRAPAVTGETGSPSVEELSAVLAELRNSLGFMAACGCTGFDRIPDAGRPEASAGGIAALDEVRSDLGDCRRCGLCRFRTHIVFGTGDPHARLMFVGEGPGYDEDLSGEPFVGRAGRLLDRIIAAMGLSRASVYICNIVKCRPPENRDPLPDEIGSCLPFLERQIEAVSPRLICTLGAVATRVLLQTSVPVSRLRGRFHDYRGIRVMPTYHPAFLLRYPEKKRETWSDMKALMSEMEMNSLLT
ncbi:uracil-DNA glycosylase [Desulfococcus sp.]|uniref:uracil-DNA glycosylase n=1 Tax=Desulfococcus sp. TaxID=2025834 RepID=UPI0035940C62